MRKACSISSSVTRTRSRSLQLRVAIAPANGAFRPSATLVGVTGVGAPFAMAACSAWLVSGSTAITRCVSAMAATMPPIRPPPPTGTTTASASGASSSISSPTVPWPASTIGSSKGGTSVRPVSSISSCRRSNASAGSCAWRSTCAPYPRVAAIFCSDAPCHMTTSASMLSVAAANAAACAWLPALIAITPLRFSSPVRLLILFSAPRDLKLPVRWKSSHLRRAPIVRFESSGVRFSRSPIVARARSTSSLVTTLPHRLEEQDGGGGARVQRVGGSRAHRDLDLHVGEGTPGVRQAVVLGADQERRRAGVVLARVLVRRADRRGDLPVREARDVFAGDVDDRQREDGARRGADRVRVPRIGL